MKASLPIRHGLALLCFLVVTCVLMAPVAPDPGTIAIGHPGNDVWNHVWGYWWVAQELVQGRLPLHTGYLRWPAGGTLWFIDSFGALLATPITLLWGPVAAYNAVLAFDLWLCGAAAYLLAWSVTRHLGGSFVAGIAFMTMPHLLGQAYNGISETLAAGWLPLAVFALREATRHPTLGRGVGAGLAVGVAFLANWYYGLFAVMVGVALLLRSGVRVLRHNRSRGGFWTLLRSPPGLSPYRSALVGQLRG
ncbi:MAG: hypothetical protein QGG40_08660, partial [Myxococcota bacterium]|nr:hypothetical protein [Myxococcota bacterium]